MQADQSFWSWLEPGESHGCFECHLPGMSFTVVMMDFYAMTVLVSAYADFSLYF